MSECKKCNAVEPQTWDYEELGLWHCDCMYKPLKRKYKIEDILQNIENCNGCVKKFNTCNPDEDYCQGYKKDVDTNK